MTHSPCETRNPFFKVTYWTESAEAPHQCPQAGQEGDSDVCMCGRAGESMSDVSFPVTAC